MREIENQFQRFGESFAVSEPISLRNEIDLENSPWWKKRK